MRNLHSFVSKPLFGRFRSTRATTATRLDRRFCNIRCWLCADLGLVNLHTRDGRRKAGQANLELTIIIGIVIDGTGPGCTLNTRRFLARFTTRTWLGGARLGFIVTRDTVRPLLLLARLRLIITLVITRTAFLLTWLHIITALVAARALLLLPGLHVVVTLIVAGAALLLTWLRVFIALIPTRALLLLTRLHIVIAIIATWTLLVLARREIVKIVAHAIIHIIAIRTFGAVILIALTALPWTALLLFLTQAIVRQHAEIMVCKLEIIFHVHTVAGHLRIARKVAIFLEQLGGVAPRAVIDPVTRIPVAAVTTTTAATLARVVPATTAADLTIIDQRFVPMLSTETWLPRIKAPSAIHTPSAERPEDPSRPALWLTASI